MKRAFTLIEMMVVIAVLVTLMAIVVRLGNIGDDAEARTMTISRMQCLENALSGFHAAFGCYPPVKLHGSRSLEVELKNQSASGSEEDKAWRAVERVCRSQPLGCRFPFSDSLAPLIDELSEFLADAAESGEFNDEGEAFESEEARKWASQHFMAPSASDVEGKLSSKKGEVLWSEIKLFQYGVMSFLLPRYLVMMGGNSKYYEGGSGGGGYAQWTENNQEPSDPYTGLEMRWSDIYNWVENFHQSQKSGNLRKNEKIVRLGMIPSQAVCARWLPNLEGICKCNYPTKVYPHMDEFFGIHIKSPHWRDSGIFDSMGTVSKGVVTAVRNTCFAPDDDNPYESMYLLDEVTVQDGWGNEFYYYSRSPYQSYTLWSAGPDRKTFPPWISRDRLQSSGSETGSSIADYAAKWTKDDVIHMSN